jgi:hypothetical protein
MEYFCGTTCFGSLPGVLAKSNGFSALKFGRKINEIAPSRRRSGDRISHKGRGRVLLQVRGAESLRLTNNAGK